MSDDLLIFQEPTLMQVVEQVDGDFILFNTTETLTDIVQMPGDMIIVNETDPTIMDVQYASGSMFVLTSGGPKGDAGTPGTAGATGQSAYEIAVANGFVGTEAQWLASLEGPPGDSPYYAEFSFATPATQWTVYHGQGTYGLMVETMDNSGNLIVGAVSYPDNNTIVIDWYYPTAGTARVFN